MDRNIDGDAATAALDHLRRVKSVALGCDQHRRRFLAGDDQHVRGVSRYVRFLVGDDLNALLRGAAPPRTCARSPQIGCIFDLTFLRRDSNDTNAEFSSIRYNELNLPLAAGVGLTLRSRDDFAGTLLPTPPTELSTESGSDGLLIVVLRRDVDD